MSKDKPLFQIRSKKRQNSEHPEIFSWYRGWCSPTIQFCPEFYFDNRWLIILSFGLTKIYWHLPFRTKKKREDESEWRTYGFYFHGEGKVFDSFWWKWGHKSVRINLPWAWDWVRTSMLLKDGKTWEHERPGKNNRKNFYEPQWEDLLWTLKHPYQYVLKSGEVQHCEAKIQVKQMEWRWVLLKRFSFPRMISNRIEINFSAEVGERSGSWKGGTLGCSYEIKKGETPLECLKRMERERKF